MRPSPTPLPYHAEPAPNRKAVRLHVAMCLYPLALVVALHGVLVMEWVHNGEPPIPPHHGPDGRLEAVVYWVASTLFVCAPFALFVHLFLMAWVVHGWNVPVVAARGQSRKKDSALKGSPQSSSTLPPHAAVASSNSRDTCARAVTTGPFQPCTTHAIRNR